jgi:uncharacterized cupin superfamily protein
VIVHWDDVRWTRIDRGPLQGWRQRLGVAAGALRAGLSRYRLGPGERAMPVHVHADEEELFFVLDGAGLSWQDGRTYRVQAGDCIVHRANREPHTILAADQELEVLAFSSGSDSHMTWLPRAGAWWMGPHWLPSDAPNPFEREAEAGDLALPEPEPSRPATIVSLRDMTPEPMRHGAVNSIWRYPEAVDRAVSGVMSGMSHIEVAPNSRSGPFHCHGAEEELFVVLDGVGMLRLGGERHAVKPGHVVARPAGTGIAHQFVADEPGLTLLAWGTRDPNDIVWYPDSNKVALRGVGVRLRVEPLDYWDGEPDG